MRRQPLVDIGGDFELSHLRARRQQFGDILDQRGQREGAMFEIDLAGFDLGIVQEFLDQRQQRIAGGFHRLGIGHLLRRQRRIQQQSAHADDAIQRRSDFMAGHRQEAGLGAIGRVGLVAGVAERALGFGAVGHIAADALHLRWLTGIRSHQALAPGDPSRSKFSGDALVVNPRAARLQRGVTLLKNLECEGTADQRTAGLPGELAIGVVDGCDEALRIAQHNQVVLRFEQAAGAFLGFL